MNLSQLLETAIIAALEAGNEIMEIYTSDKINVDYKEDHSPLTKADLKSNEIILSHLEKTELPVLSEEEKEIPYDVRKKWSRLWIVDPIDGTKEFIKKNGEFTVNIALIENQRPILGVIFAPALNQLYFSTLTMGAYKLETENKGSSWKEMLREAKKLPMNKPSTYTIVASRSHLSDDTEKFIDDLKEKHIVVDIISKGSSLKLCMVAEGAANCYPRFAPTMEWDTAAGQAICEHAGFKVIDWETKQEMIYNRKELLNNWFLVH